MPLLIAVALGISLGQPTEPACSLALDGSEYLRESQETWVVARVLPDTARAAEHPERASLLRGDPAGHVLEIVDGVGLESSGIAAAGSRVAVFTWTLGASCEWRSRGVELEPGSTHHFPMTLRPEAMWSEGVPTFDVIPAGGLDVFPGRTRVRDVEWQRYLEFIDRVPTRSEWAVDCRPFLDPLREWDHGRAPRWGFAVAALWRACESGVRNRAEALGRISAPEVPGSVLGWSRRAECTIRQRWDESLDAVDGAFFQSSDRRAWAVACETPTHTRLVVIDEASGTLEAELLSVAGAVPNWHLSVVPPTYFEWVHFGPTLDPEGQSPPDGDAVALRGHLWMTFAYVDGGWVGYPSMRNGLELRMPRRN